MPFVFRSIVQNGSDLTDAAAITHSLEYAAFSRPFDLLYLLKRFEY